MATRFAAASFSGDGARVITASADKTARIWDVAVDLKAPLPEWVPELAEALGGQRFDEWGDLEPPKKSSWNYARNCWRAHKDDDFWSRFGRWFFLRGPERTISPDSNITVAEFERLQAEAAAKDNSTRAKTSPGTP